MLEYIAAYYLVIGTGYVGANVVTGNEIAATSPCAGQMVDVVGKSWNVLYKTCKN